MSTTIITTDKVITREEFDAYVKQGVPVSRFQASGSKELLILEINPNGTPRRVVEFYAAIFG